MIFIKIILGDDTPETASTATSVEDGSNNPVAVIYTLVAVISASAKNGNNA
jgi:NhaP-type Na+/H+ and K+/H+ antiporter